MTPFPSIRRDATLLLGATEIVYVWLLVAALSLSPVTAQFEGCPPELNTANAVTNILNSTVDIPQTCIPPVPGAASPQGRCYYTYVPPCAARADQGVPLVLDLHGIGSCPAASAFYTGWATKATTECFVVAWPMGTVDTDVATISCFSVPGGVPTTAEAADDNNNVASDCCCFRGFLPLEPAVTQDPLVLRNMIIDLVQGAPTVHNVSIDPTRIYMAGHSNGCIASLAMAALQSDLVAAVCCHAGYVATPIISNPDLYSPVPIWRVHGEKDDTIPYDGGVVLGQQFVSAQRGLEYFGNVNGCSVEIVTTPLPGGVGTRMTRVNCTNNATVELVSLTESGHSPYAGATEFDTGASDTTMDTTSMAWDFCSAFRKSDVPPVFAESVTPTTVAPSTQQQPTTVPSTLPSGDASMPRLSSFLGAVVGAYMVVHLLG